MIFSGMSGETEVLAPDGEDVIQQLPPLTILLRRIWTSKMNLRKSEYCRSPWRSATDFVNHNAAPLFFFIGLALVGAAAEVEDFAVGGEGGGGGAGEEADADADAAAAMRGGHNETTAGMHDALQEIHEFGEEVGLSEDILLNQ